MNQWPKQLGTVREPGFDHFISQLAKENKRVHEAVDSLVWCLERKPTLGVELRNDVWVLKLTREPLDGFVVYYTFNKRILFLLMAEMID